MTIIAECSASRLETTILSACARMAAIAHVWAGSLVLVAASLWALQYYPRVAPTQPDSSISLATPLDTFLDDPPVVSASDWVDRRAPLLRAAFQHDIYGELPAVLPLARSDSRLIDANAFDGAGRIEEVTLSLTGSSDALRLDVLLALPASETLRGAPVVIVPNFCGNRAALGYRYLDASQPNWIAERCRSDLGRMTTELLHGDSIIRLPMKEFLRAGYAVVTFSPGQVVPDDPRLAGPAIDRLPSPVNGGPQVGAIGAWSWTISRATDLVLSDPRLDSSRIALFGHSRFGKAALLTAALDTRIGAVIANQSGRLGAAPSSDSVGEPLPSLLNRFPHWFPEQARDAVPQAHLDQQHLLALIAPRPMLLGGATLDRWSDPVGAFQSAQSAAVAYRLLGGAGLVQPSMQATDLDADIAYFFRSGGHGVRKSDYATAIAFLNRHFAPKQTGGPARLAD